MIDFKRKIYFPLFLIIALSVFHGGVMAGQNNSIQAQDRHLIVMAAPSVNNSYYKDFFKELIEFDIAMVKAITGNDMIVILVDQSTKKYFKGKVSEEILLESDIADIWVRDIGTVFPGVQTTKWGRKNMYSEIGKQTGGAVFLKNSRIFRFICYPLKIANSYCMSTTGIGSPFLWYSN